MRMDFLASHSNELLLMLIAILPIVVNLLLFEFSKYDETIFQSSWHLNSVHLKSLQVFNTVTTLCLAIIIVGLEDIILGKALPGSPIAIVIGLLVGWQALSIAQKTKFLRERRPRVILSLVAVAGIVAYKIMSLIIS